MNAHSTADGSSASPKRPAPPPVLHRREARDADFLAAFADAAVETARFQGAAGRVVCVHRAFPGSLVRRTCRFTCRTTWR